MNRGYARGRNIVPAMLSILLLLSFNAAPAAAGQGKAVPSGDGVLVRYKARAGAESLYKLNMSGETTIFVEDQSQMTIVDNEMLLSQKVAAVDDSSGVITYRTTVTSGKMTINGVPSPLPMIGQVLETKMKPDGTIVLSRGQAGGKLDNLQLVFPREPVRVGSTWTSRLPATAQVPVPLVMTYKVLAFQEYRGRKCVKIATTIVTDDDGAPPPGGLTLELDAKGKIFFDIDRGELVSNRVNSDIRMSMRRKINGRPTSIITRMKMRVRLELQF